MKTERVCPYDGSLFMPKRTNQVFACRENQIAFNNEKAKKAKESTLDIDKVLKKNRRICEDLLKGKQSSISVSKDYLFGMGFNINVYTMTLRINNNRGVGIYEFFYQEDNGQFIIGRRDGKY